MIRAKQARKLGYRPTVELTIDDLYRDVEFAPVDVSPWWHTIRSFDVWWRLRK